MQPPADAAPRSPASATPQRSTADLAATRRALRVAIGVAVAVPLVLLATLAWNSHQAAQARAAHETELAARLAAEHVGRIVQANSIVTRQVQLKLASMPLADDGSAAAALHRELADLADGLPHLNSIWVLGADGFPRASSLSNTVPRINYADREYFRFHQAERGKVFVSRLLRTRSTNELFYDVSARWESATGTFLGVINVTLRPQYLTEFFSQVGATGRPITLSLLRDDGYLIARWPQQAEVGDRLPETHPLLRALAARAPDGWVPAAGTDAAADATSFRRLAPWPLAVAATLDRAAVTRAWTRDIAGVGAGALLAMALLLGALGFALRRTDEELATQARLAAEVEQRTRAEAALRQAQKLEALGQLTGGVAHDFNNLLAVLQNNLHVLAHQQPALAASPAFAGMQRAVRSGEQLTRKLLAFARRQPLRPEVLDLAQVLPQIADLLRISLGRSVAVEVEVAPDTPWVRVDRSEFELALLNLAMNARHAGATQFTVRAAPVAPDGTPGSVAAVAIAVRDDGRGMSSDVLARAFEPFYTTKPEGEGTGLGLSQVYAMCVQSGGQAALDSAPGAGTTVRLQLPAVPSEAPAPATLQAAAEPLRAHVLVVEDHAELARATATVLESLGARVTLAADASAALARLQEDGNAIDVVLSDIVMPGAMNGMGLARALRERRPDLPIVLMTGYTSELQSALAAGLDVLPKPIAPPALAAVLREAVQRHAATESRSAA